jgi:anti-sigma regulatory factor (Ser/Thr protein kinase)
MPDAWLPCSAAASYTAAGLLHGCRQGEAPQPRDRIDSSPVNWGCPTVATAEPAAGRAGDRRRQVGAVEAVLLQASTSLSGHPRSAGDARRFVAGSLEPWLLGPLVDTVTLLTSELVTNALVHAGSDVDVVVRLTSVLARVEVTDRSEVASAPRSSSLEDDAGRGLALVQALARRWGTSRQPGGGKTVWFEVARRAAEGGPAATEAGG